MKKLRIIPILLVVVLIANICSFSTFAESTYVITDVALTPGATEVDLNLAWYTTESPSDTVAQFALKQDMTGGAFPANKAITYTGSNTPATTGLASNKVSVKNLEESTEYVYRIGDGTEENWSPVYNYTTGNPDKFGFVFVGDPQVGYADTNAEAQAWGSTITKALNRLPDTRFVMSAGDQVQKNNIALYNAFFSPEILRSLPIAPAMGNHEAGATHFSLHFNLPNITQYGKTGTGGEDGDYYFNYGNTLFMVLNTNNMYSAEHTAFMREAVKANPDTKWKVLMFHHSIYSTTDHYTGAYVSRFIEGMVPTIDDLGIDIVLMGHDHVYVRTHLMKKNTVMSQQTIDDEGNVVNPDGTIYITGNSPSGSKFYEIQLIDPAFAAVNSQLNVTTFSYVNVEGRKLSLDTYRTDTMEIVDSVSIVKNNPVNNYNGLSVDSLSFIKDGVKIGGIYKGDTGNIVGKANLSNISSLPYKAMLVAARYNKDKQLVDIKPSELTDVLGYDGVVGGCSYATIKTPAINAQEVKPGDYIKLFLWEDTNGIVPYANPIDISMLEEEIPPPETNIYTFECENLVASPSGADAVVEGDYSILNSDGTGDYIEYNVNFPAAGTWNISLVAKTNPNGGKFRLFLPQSDKYVGTSEHDQYSPEENTTTINIGNYSFKSGGNKQLRFIVTGKNDSSGGYTLTNDKIILVKQ